MLSLTTSAGTTNPSIGPCLVCVPVHTSTIQSTSTAESCRYEETQSQSQSQSQPQQKQPIMTTRTCPWQYEWKRPQWSAVQRETPETKQQSRIEGTPLGVTSAQLSLSEALSLGVQHDDSLVLTITLYDSFHRHRGQGDVLLLELLTTTTTTPTDPIGRLVCIKDRILHWPGLAVHKQGLSSMALARQPPPRTATHPPTIDALDVLNRMSLGGMAITAEPQYEQQPDGCEL